MPNSEIVHQFDEQRPAFTPYGLTCVQWRATRTGRPDRHNEVELNLLEAGTLTYLLSGRRLTVHPGRLTAFWAIAPHQIVGCDGETPYYVATIPLNLFLQWKLPAPFVDRILSGELVAEPAVNGVAAGADALHFRQWIQDLSAGSAELMEIALLQMQARLRRMTLRCAAAEGEAQAPIAPPLDVQSSSKIEQMAMYVATNYQRPIKVEEISGVVGLHPDYATALFKKAFGMTLVRYALEHRISHAQRMLSTTRDKVSAIAFGSGFDSISRFNAAFKAVVGCTPRHYRSRQKGWTSLPGTDTR